MQGEWAQGRAQRQAPSQTPGPEAIFTQESPPCPEGCKWKGTGGIYVYFCIQASPERADSTRAARPRPAGSRPRRQHPHTLRTPGAPPGPGPLGAVTGSPPATGAANAKGSARLRTTEAG